MSSNEAREEIKNNEPELLKTNDINYSTFKKNDVSIEMNFNEVLNEKGYNLKTLTIIGLVFLNSFIFGFIQESFPIYMASFKNFEASTSN